MDINFPLILVCAVGFTGAVWLLEVVWWRGHRAAAAGGATDTGDGELPPEPLLVEYSISFFPVLAIVLILRSFLVEPFQIPTGSMIPTLAVGDFILVNKYAYGVRLPVIGTKILDVDEPKTGEVMVFIPPHEPDYFIKRVIGTPGDRVRYQDKTLYINGEVAAQEFVARIPPARPRYVVYEETIGGVPHLIHRSLGSDPSTREWVIPEGKYFMMGDNRDRSSDSRTWGLVSEENIVGKAFAIWVHKEPGFHLPTFERNGWIE